MKAWPSDFSAYVSVGTAADIGRGDSMKFAFLKEEVTTRGESKDKADVENWVRRLEGILKSSSSRDG